MWGMRRKWRLVNSREKGELMKSEWKAIVAGLLLAGIAIAQETAASKNDAPARSASEVHSQKMTAHQAAGSKVETKNGAAKGERQGPITFNSAKEKVSYALGVELAAGLKYQRMDVDLPLIIRGMRDAFANEDTKLAMPPKEIADTLKQYGEDRKRGLEHAMQMVSEKNKKAGEDFVAQNAKKDGVVTLPSGLQYKVLKEGDGNKPVLADSIVCNYRGTLVDGTEFDSSYKQNKPVTFPLKSVIKGWREAIQLMPVGSKWQLVVPPQLGYGERGAGGIIGPNTTLVFEVELVSIGDKVAGAAQAQEQTQPKAVADAGAR
jgi:FKBP-type peptidyl-prolyl cis-trans isomerase FklB